MKGIQQHLSDCLAIVSDYEQHTISQADASKKLDVTIHTLQNTKSCSDASIAFITSLQSKLESNTSRNRIQNTGLPTRYISNPITHHVSSLPNHHNGLVHGAIIHKKDYDIICYAHRWFYHKSERWGKNWCASNSYLKEEIGGLYQKVSKVGTALTNPISYTTLFPEIFKSATAPNLLDTSCKTTLYCKNFGVKGMEQSWFYMPNDYDHTKHFTRNPQGFDITFDLLHNIPSAQNSITTVIHSDTKIPSVFTNSKAFYSMYYGTTTPHVLPTSLTYQVTTEATQGFVVNSPYIKVFSIAPEFPETIIAINHAWRSCAYEAFGSYIERKVDFDSKWQVNIITS